MGLFMNDPWVSDAYSLMIYSYGIFMNHAFIKYRIDTVRGFSKCSPFGLSVVVAYMFCVYLAICEN